MFVGLAKKYSTQNALNDAFESRLKDVDKDDFLALTRLYLQVFNPTKVKSAEQLVEKFKVCHHMYMCKALCLHF